MTGEFYHKWRIISLRGFYGTYGKAVITKFLVIWTLTHGYAQVGRNIIYSLDGDSGFKRAANRTTNCGYVFADNSG